MKASFYIVLDNSGTYICFSKVSIFFVIAQRPCIIVSNSTIIIISIIITIIIIIIIIIVVTVIYNTYLLLAECEVRTASYGPSFFLPFMKTRKEKTRIHNLSYGPSKRG